MALISVTPPQPPLKLRGARGELCELDRLLIYLFLYAREQNERLDHKYLFSYPKGL